MLAFSMTWVGVIYSYITVYDGTLSSGRLEDDAKRHLCIVNISAARARRSFIVWCHYPMIGHDGGASGRFPGVARSRGASCV